MAVIIVVKFYQQQAISPTAPRGNQAYSAVYNRCYRLLLLMTALTRGTVLLSPGGMLVHYKNHP